MPAPADALDALAARLRDERSVIAHHVGGPGEGAVPALGLLAAAGTRARSAPGEYALVVEAVREGYLLHHGAPRLLADPDPDLALLAGDYLYALGIERLAALGDLVAVRELADLISLAAQVHARGGGAEAANALWLGCVAAIGCGVSPTHTAAKEALREGHPGAADLLLQSAREAAGGAGIGEALDGAVEAIDFGGRRG